MKRYRRAVCVTGEYVQKGTNETKRQYANVGTLFQREDGSLCMKMDSVPVGDGWNGWINFYEIDDKPKQERKPAAAAPQEDFSDDIPF